MISGKHERVMKGRPFLGFCVSLFISSVLATTSLSAQKKWIEDFEVYGGLGTINNAGNGSYMDNTSSKVSFSLGAGAIHSFSKLLDMNLRLGYERKGFRDNENYYNPYSQQNERIEIDQSINCLTTQLLPVFKLGRERRIRLGLGAYFSIPYNVSEHVNQYDQSGNLIMQASGASSKTRGVSNDFGFSTFGGYSFKVGGYSELNVQAMINTGVLYYAQAFGGQIRNRIYSIVVSYRFKRKPFRQ